MPPVRILEGSKQSTVTSIEALLRLAGTSGPVDAALLVLDERGEVRTFRTRYEALYEGVALDVQTFCRRAAHYDSPGG